MASRHLSTPLSSRKTANPYEVRATGVRPPPGVSTPAAATSRVRKALYMSSSDSTPAPEPASAPEGASEPDYASADGNLGGSLLFECDIDTPSDKQLDDITSAIF